MQLHMPQERDHLASPAQHKMDTQAKYYQVHDKVMEIDFGGRVVKKLVSLHTCKNTQARKKGKTSDGWKTGETDELKKLFQLEIETGSIKERDVSKKLVNSSMFKQCSIKAVVLKLNRLGKDHVQ